MSGSRWVIKPSWLSGSWRSFLCSSSVYSCHLVFNIFCFCWIHNTSVLSYAHLCLKYSFGISNFLEEISSLSYSVVFLSLFPLITEAGFLISLAILWNSAFRWVYLSFSPLPLASLLFSAFCEASWGNHFAFLHFFFLGMVLITASYTMSQTSIHNSSGTLSDLIFGHFHCIILRDLS